MLPPSVLGFYILVAMGPHGPIGQLTQSLGLGLMTFNFSGLVVGSIIYSLPFAVQPLQGVFESIGNRPMEVAATLGAKPLDAFFSVVIPLARPGFLTAMVLTFAHTIGEFGVVLMIGGNIPGKTQVGLYRDLHFRGSHGVRQRACARGRHARLLLPCAALRDAL